MAVALNRPARLLVTLVVAAGALALAVQLRAVSSWSARDAAAALAVAVAIAALDQLALALPQGTETEYFSLTDSIWTATLLLAPSSVLVLGVAAGTLAGQSLRGFPRHKAAFNAGQVVLGLSAAAAVFHASGAPAADEPRAWLYAAVAMLACFAVNAGAVALAIALATETAFVRVLAAPLRMNLSQWIGNVALGVLAALVWTTSPAGELLLLLPLALLWLAYGGWLRALIERDRMKEMARTADAIAHQGDLGKRLPAAEDGTPLAVLAATLNGMLERLESAFRRERRFIREAAQELHTPLTISRGHLEALAERPDPAELRETIALVLAEFDRMGRILSDMTALARSQQPAFVRPVKIHLGTLLENVAAKARALLGDRLRTDLGTDGAVVRADPERLTQAFVNLLQNAAVHAPDCDAVELRAVAEERFWRVEVADSGPGVPPGDEEAVFQPFYQAVNAGVGSGLGLALVRSIAEAHGGSAGVESRPGAGATFWIRVPRTDLV